MAKTTAIQWCDSTCNPIIGCDGCELAGGHCYAENLCRRFAGRTGYPDDFRKPILKTAALEQAIKWPSEVRGGREKKPWLAGWPRVIFVCDLGDPFCPSTRQFGFWESVGFDLMDSSDSIFILLTKWPQNMAQAVRSYLSNRSGWPANVWLGVSVNSYVPFWRIDHLRAIPQAPKILSWEPMTGPPPIDLRGRLAGIDWLIVGGESGPGARLCRTSWIEELVMLSTNVNLPLFIKQLGSHSDVTGLADSKGGDWREWPERLRIREMPRWDADRAITPSG